VVPRSTATASSGGISCRATQTGWRPRRPGENPAGSTSCPATRQNSSRCRRFKGRSASAPKGEPQTDRRGLTRPRRKAENSISNEGLN
jgi:hypothetical protein